MTPSTPNKNAARDLCPNCGHDQNGRAEYVTHCLSCSYPLPASANEYARHEAKSAKRLTLPPKTQFSASRIRTV